LKEVVQLADDFHDYMKKLNKNLDFEQIAKEKGTRAPIPSMKHS
jgi:hypothetical protein